MPRSLQIAALLGFAIFQAGPVAASDGQVLITHEKALAGYVTPGDDPEYPITISRSGSYKLAGNLSPAERNGIVVTASAVTIDFAGFSLIGNGTGTGIGVSGSLHSLTIKNGTIAKMGGGWHLRNRRLLGGRQHAHAEHSS